MTHRIAGDGLHIPWVLPIASSLRRSLNMYKDNFKQSQTLPLKEDFRQFPGQVTGQVFQTTWRLEAYLNANCLYKQSKAKSSQGTKQLKYLKQSSRCQYATSNKTNRNRQQLSIRGTWMCKAQGLRHVSQATYKTKRLGNDTWVSSIKRIGLNGHLMVNLKSQAQR